MKQTLIYLGGWYPWVCAIRYAWLNSKELWLRHVLHWVTLCLYFSFYKKSRGSDSGWRPEWKRATLGAEYSCCSDKNNNDSDFEDSDADFGVSADVFARGQGKRDLFEGEEEEEEADFREYRGKNEGEDETLLQAR